MTLYCGAIYESYYSVFIIRRGRCHTGLETRYNLTTSVNLIRLLTICRHYITNNSKNCRFISMLKNCKICRIVSWQIALSCLPSLWTTTAVFMKHNAIASTGNSNSDVNNLWGRYIHRLFFSCKIQQTTT